MLMMVYYKVIFAKNEERYNYISLIDKEMWTNAYDGGYRYGHMTTNLAEAINSTLNELQRPLQGIEAVSLRVHLRDRTCDCGFFQALKYPCSHVIAAYSHTRQDYNHFVDPIYILSEVFKGGWDVKGWVFRGIAPPAPRYTPRDAKSTYNAVQGVCFTDTAGLVIGYYFFIHIDPSDVTDPGIQPLVDEDPETLKKMLPEIPFWVKNPDYERVDWLNKFLEYMWPNLNKAICTTAKNIAKPIIDEQISQYKIDAVEFETFTLGSLPPTFQGIGYSINGIVFSMYVILECYFLGCGTLLENSARHVKSKGMKVYVTEEEELIMEPLIKWAANPNVTIAVRAYGMKATVQVIDLQVFAMPRITLKPLVPSFPCFANIFVSLMEKPHVDFGLKLVGIDLMSIPILYRVVQEIIKYQVANMYLWPKTLRVEVLDPAKAFDRPVGILHVKVIRAMQLIKKDLLGSSDPYVKIKLTESKLPAKKTTVKMKNLNPEWNEEFNVTVKDPQTQVLKLQVIDWEKLGKHDKMGMNEVPLQDLAPDEPKVMTLELLKNKGAEESAKDKSRGQLVVELTYKPFKEEEIQKTFQESRTLQRAPDNTPDGGGMLVIIVHEAEHIEGKSHTNPYKVKKNRDPRWEEEFKFMLDEPPHGDKIHLEICSSSSRMGLRLSKERLGFVDINLSDVVINKRINERYHLIDSKNGRIQIELQWRTKE
ncbi:Synaptotagmin-1 [Hibiscus syriacus]|uniref:Synaptotagmin-1 n=1 Tax=Hibiscus syriacus TaxID=106335 RepID=A0A6A3AF21_HIBSY|nr:Synaptotagmin-1 [Hibiscus syriacus]